MINDDELSEHQTEMPPKSDPFMWISETHTPNDIYQHGINRIIHFERTEYQDMLIADVGAYGRALFLDGCLQTSEGDEAFYHEAITHPACLSIGASLSSVLILGGGDGGTAREVLRWSSVERIVIVEIDRAVVDASRKHLPALSKGAFDNPRVEVIYDDAHNYLKECDEQFDVIICDLTDPIENGPSAALFAIEFFKTLQKHLKEQGAICLQSGTMSLSENDVNLARIFATLKKVFEHVNVMQVFAPKYGTPLALTLATNIKLQLPSAEKIDALFREKLSGENHVLDGRAVHGLFAIPKCVSDALCRRQELLTNENRIKLSGHGLL